ncbi:hypothetical protein Tco_1040526 [Tanacetum coccineum]
MATEDIISIGSFVEVLVLNHYVPVRKILGKLSMLQDEEAQNKTNIQEPRMPCGLLNFLDKMAEENVPAPTRTDEQLVPVKAHLPIGKRNLLMDIQKI